MTTRVVLASNNAGKLRELRRILEPCGLELLSPSDLNLSGEPEEDGGGFLSNALIKARYWASRIGMPALADDSGLCVDALHGEPGVESANYAGQKAADAENVRKLLGAMDNVAEPERTAHYHCTAVCVRPDGAYVYAVGRAEGVVLREPRGNGGFGYDPVIWDPTLGLTYAQMDARQKDARSHRGAAFRGLVGVLRAFTAGA